MKTQSERLSPGSPFLNPKPGDFNSPKLEVSMNKAELVNAVAKEAEISKSKAAVALDTVIASISHALKNKEKVTLVGFGTFSTATRSARTGRNPRDGKAIRIAAKVVAKFKPGKKLADEVNGKGGHHHHKKRK